MRTLDRELLERIKDYIVDYQKDNGKSPNFRQIMFDMRMKSLGAVGRYVRELERLGKIERTSNGSIAVLPCLQASDLAITHLVGDVACGEPLDAIENIEESFALPRSLFGSGEMFMLRTFGDSMIDVGIERGDLVVVRKQNTASDGDIIVAMVDGATTLKRYYKEGNKIILHPENETMEDIIVDHCEIQGILISCIKMF